MIGTLKTRPDANGWFEPVLGRQPPFWPWAMPHYFAVNYAPDPEPVNHDRCRIEVIGFWRGEYHVFDVQHVTSRDKAAETAQQNFKDLHIRFLLNGSSIVRENHKIEVTGDWPKIWQFDRIGDLGVLCAYIYEKTKQRGAGPAADGFRDSIGHAWPIIEQVATFEACLNRAMTNLYPWLSSEAKEAIHNALWTIKQWRSSGAPPN